MAKTRRAGSSSQIPGKDSRLKKNDMSSDLGGSGTAFRNGFIEHEYNSTLQGWSGLNIYEKMRKSDAQVQASLLVMELPIRSTEWFIEPAVDENNNVTPEAQEIADFVHEALFERMSIAWDDYLHEVLTCLPFGHSVFEKVYDADDEHVWIDKLASRKQSTIQKWQTADGGAGITQQLSAPMTSGPNEGKHMVSIPAQKLLVFTINREGDNLEGTSVLRSAYKHWYIKDSLYKFDSVKHERQGIGIPMLKLPAKATDADKREAKLILARLRANEQQGVVLPEGFTLEYADTKAGTNSDMKWSVEHHNAMIAKNVLAMFMEIVTGEGGSRALSEDQSDFFLLALEAVARMIDEVHSRYLIPELVSLNYPNAITFPRLAHKKLGNVDYQRIMTALSTGSAAGIIDPDFDLEVWARKLMDLPAKMSPEAKAEIQQEEADAGLMDPLGLEDEEDIVEVDEDGEPIEDEEIEEIQATETRFFAMHDGVYAFHEGDWMEHDGQEFRIVSEATKKKISEALKRRGGRSRIRVDKENLRQEKSPVRKARAARVSKRVKALKQKARSAKNIAAKKRVGQAIRALNARIKAADPVVHVHPMHAPDPVYQAYSSIFDNKRIIALQNSVRRDDLPAIRSKGFRFNDFEDEAWRGLTFAERKVNLTSLKKAMQKAEADLTTSMGEVTEKMKEDLLEQVKKAVDNNDIAAVGKIKAKYTGELAGALTDVQKQMFDIGKTGAAAEMAVKAPATLGEVKGVMRVGNDKLVEKLAADMENAAAQAVTQAAAKRGGSITQTGVAEAVGAAGASIDRIIEQAAQLRTLTLTGALNLGRASIFERFPELIYGFQFSAILDDKTTDTCLSLDGRVVAAGSPDFYTYAPPRHYNCRSIWVEILNEEEFKPEFDDIPASVPDNATIDVHKEMKAPEVKAGSAAARVLREELEDRRAKVEDLEASGKFPNRLASHKKRIAELEGQVGEEEFTDGAFDLQVRAILRADGIRFTDEHAG